MGLLLASTKWSSTRIFPSAMTAGIGDNDIYIRDVLYRRCCYTGDMAEQQLNINREERERYGGSVLGRGQC